MRPHMDFRYDDGHLSPAAIVFLADKLVREDRRIDLAERFRPALERFAGQPEALAGAQRRFDNARRVLVAVEQCTGESCERLLADCGVPA